MKSPLKYLRRMMGDKTKCKYWWDDYRFEIAYSKHMKMLKKKVKGGYED